MGQQTQWREPSEFAAGDTLAFEKRLSDYPAGQGWSLKYELRGGNQLIEFTSVADGDSHSMTVTAATTANWLPGDYILAGYVVLASTGERHQIYEGPLTITPNFPTTAGNVPVLTFAQQMVAQLELAMLAKAGDDLAASQLGETRFHYLTPEQLRTEHGYWKGVRRNEIALMNARNGKPTGNKIRPRINVTGTGPVLGSSVWPFSGQGPW